MTLSIFGSVITSLALPAVTTALANGSASAGIARLVATSVLVGNENGLDAFLLEFGAVHDQVGVRVTEAFLEMITPSTPSHQSA